MPAMRKVVIFAVVLMLIGVGASVVVNAPRGVVSTQIGIDPLQMMAHAQELPAPHYDF